MNVQRAVLKLYTRGLLAGPGHWLLRARPWTVEAGEAAGLKIGFPQNLDFIAGTSERPVQETLVGQLRPGDIFYDIGANVGFFSLIGARAVGAAGRVYAFEPVDENAQAIARNARLNRFDHITVLEVAAGDRDETAPLFVTEWDGGASLARSAIKTSERVLERQVQMSRVDDLVETHGLKPPTLVKIDVEGAEMAVLRGMQRTLEDAKPVVLFEVDDADVAELSCRWNELDAYLAAMGYTITHLRNSYPNVGWHVGHTLAIAVRR
jgi:FkbM family methyltransferase